MNVQLLRRTDRVPANWSLMQALQKLANAARQYARNFRATRERNALYRCYRQFDAARLKDIGMDDPEAQLRAFGRYL